MTRPRVLVLTSDLSGNSTITAWQFCGALRRAGWDPVLAGAASGEPWLPLRAELSEAVNLGPPAVRFRPKVALELARDVDLVYAFKALPTSLGLGLHLAWRSGLPLGLHLDDWDAGFLREHSWLRRAYWTLKALQRPEGDLWLWACERAVRKANVLTVSTTALQQRFGGTVVRQGVDTERLSPARYPRSRARERLGISADAPMVLFLGTPRRHKGIAMLASLKGLDDALWIVGMRPGDEAELGLAPGALGRIRVRPPVDYEEAAWYLAACDVFVAPQADTAFAAHQVPAKILKAMALGIPIVTTDVGDARDLLAGDPAAGTLVPPGNPDALGAAIRRLLADRVLAGALGAEARRRAEEQHGWSAMARTLERVLDPVAPAQGEGPRRFGRPRLG